MGSSTVQTFPALHLGSAPLAGPQCLAAIITEEAAQKGTQHDADLECQVAHDHVLDKFNRPMASSIVMKD